MNLSLRFMLSSLALAPLAVAQLPISPGNILVSRIGDGSSALAGGPAAPRFLDEYTQAGVFVQTIALPTTAALPQRALTNSGSATSEGYISQSADGNYFILVGYDAAPGTASVASTSAATTARVIGRVDLIGTIDTSTGLTDAYSGNNIRSACSTDGTSFWTGGNASAANGPGARYVASLGASTSTQLTVSPSTNLRVVNIFNGQLYTSAGIASLLGVGAVGTGLPTTSGQTTTPIATATGNANYDFFFADASTLYLADERTNGSGGIQKWTESGGVWTLAYTLQPNATTGCRGLSGFTEAGVTTLFATTNDATGATEVASVVDGGPGSAFTFLVPNATNIVLRDVQFVRTPSQVIYSGTDCATTVGTPTQTVVGGYPVAGNSNLGILATNCVPFAPAAFALEFDGPQPVGISVFGPFAPPCALAYLQEDLLFILNADPTGSFLFSLPVPNSASLGGAIVTTQIASYDPALAGIYPFPYGTSLALTLVIGN